MPLKSGKKNAGKNIAEFHAGPRYKAAAKKYGKAKADKIAVAAGLAASRRKKKR